MSTKFTPGPWFGGTTVNDGTYCIVGDGDSVVCEFRGRTGETVYADARLIAAAPELLEALKLAVRQNSHDMLMTGEELRQCEAAIALLGEQA